MKTLDIINIKKITKPDTKRYFLGKIPITTNNTIDEVNKILWGVLTKEELNNLENFWFGKNLNEDVLLQTKKTAVMLLQVLSSLCSKVPQNKKIDNLIINELCNCGIGLEYFILDSLLRNNKENKNLKFIKGPKEYDKKKIDFLNIYRKIIFGIQLTTTKSKKVSRKDIELNNVRKDIDKKGEKIFKIDRVPDLPILFVINSNISEKLNGGNIGGDNIFMKAYIKWKSEGFTKLGPSKYLQKPIKKDLHIISTTYPLIIDIFFDFINNNNINISYEKVLNCNDKFIIHINYDHKNKKYKVSLLEKIKKGEHKFIYSLTFYLTNRFFKKLNINEKVSGNYNRKNKKGNNKKGKKTKKKSKKYINRTKR